MRISKMRNVFCTVENIHDLKNAFANNISVIRVVLSKWKNDHDCRNNNLHAFTYNIEDLGHDKLGWRKSNAVVQVCSPEELSCFIDAVKNIYGHRVDMAIYIFSPLLREKSNPEIYNDLLSKLRTVR
jgi:hypothetical protein